MIPYSRIQLPNTQGVQMTREILLFAYRANDCTTLPLISKIIFQII